MTGPTSTSAPAPQRLRVLPRGPHDTARLLSFLGRHAVPGVEAWDGGTWSSSLRLAGGPAVLQVAVPAGRTIDVRLHLSDPADRPQAVRAARHVLDLDHDVRPAQRHLAGDPLLGPLLSARPGLHLPGVLDPFELVVRTVIGQQVSLAGARTVCGRLVHACGAALPAGLRDAVPGLTRTFPTPAAVAALDADGDALAMPRARARAVVAVAEAFRDRTGVPDRAELLALPGIGPWTADYVDARVRRDPDVLLDTDLAVRRAIGPDVGSRAVAELGLAWAPHRTTALVQLWTSYLEG